MGRPLLRHVRQYLRHTSGYVSRHYVSIRQHTASYVRIRHYNLLATVFKNPATVLRTNFVKERRETAKRVRKGRKEPRPRASTEQNLLEFRSIEIYRACSLDTKIKLTQPWDDVSVTGEEDDSKPEDTSWGMSGMYAHVKADAHM